MYQGSRRNILNQIVLLGQVKCVTNIIGDWQEQFQRNGKGKKLPGVDSRYNVRRGIKTDTDNPFK